MGRELTVPGPARVAIRNLDKTFGQVKVLSGVNLEIAAGEVHGLAGQNGSGKSTLVKIMTGLHLPDSGAEVCIDGRPVHLPVRWPEVHRAGVSVVHQDLGLLDELSVADNICAGGFPRHQLTRRIDRGRQVDLAHRALRRVGATIDPLRLAGSLSAPERAEVALARALRDHRSGSGLVILDESTRSLAGADLRRVHQVLRALTDDGTSFLLISHSLPELLAVADRVTVLRDGRVVGAGLGTSGLAEEDLARRMLGPTADMTGLDEQRSPTTANLSPRGEAALAVDGLTGGRVQGITFTVDAGEVLGVTGLPGGGVEDIPFLLAGATPATAGTLTSGGVRLDLSRTSIRQLLRAGVVLVPEDRLRHGLAADLSVGDNLTLPNLRRRGLPWFLGRGWRARDADAAVATFGIRPTDPSRLVKTLSGGNQQKVLLGKWLGASPRVLVLHEPTQAVDVGARRDIVVAIRRAAADGVAVVLVSSEPSDLCALCHRVLIVEPAGGTATVAVTTPDELLARIYRTYPLDTKVG